MMFGELQKRVESKAPALEEFASKVAAQKLAREVPAANYGQRAGSHSIAPTASLEKEPTSTGSRRRITFADNIPYKNKEIKYLNNDLASQQLRQKWEVSPPKAHQNIFEDSVAVGLPIRRKPRSAIGDRYPVPQELPPKRKFNTREDLELSDESDGPIDRGIGLAKRRRTVSYGMPTEHDSLRKEHRGRDTSKDFDPSIGWDTRAVCCGVDCCP